MLLVEKKSHRAVRILNVLFAAVSLTGILWLTVFRSSSGQRILQLIPFYSLVEAQVEREMYRELLMNVLLFVPLGLTLPFATDGLSKKLSPVALTVITALCLSLLIELIQYIFALGHIEADDVIFNTIGAAIGAIACRIYIKGKKKFYAD